MNKEKICIYLGGVIFIYFAIKNAIDLYQGFVGYQLESKIVLIIRVIANIAMAAGFFTNNKKIIFILTIVSCVLSVRDIITGIRINANIKEMMKYYDDSSFRKMIKQNYLGFFICFVELISFASLSFLTSTKNKSLFNLYFLPAVLELVGGIVYIVIGRISFGYPFSFNNIINTILMPVSLFCIGICFVSDTLETRTETIEKEEVSSLSTDNAVERITKLKSLLDKGIITEEEFASKKKEILSE